MWCVGVFAGVCVCVCAKNIRLSIRTAGSSKKNLDAMTMIHE